MQLKDISAIVTGGASGLGAATARALAAKGAKVAVCDLNTKLAVFRKLRTKSDIGKVFFYNILIHDVVVTHQNRTFENRLCYNIIL